MGLAGSRPAPRDGAGGSAGGPGRRAPEKAPGGRARRPRRRAKPLAPRLSARSATVTPRTDEFLPDTSQLYWRNVYRKYPTFYLLRASQVTKWTGMSEAAPTPLRGFG